MAVPKHKVSKAAGRSRVANWRATAPTLTKCPQCHELVPAHSACPACGFYKGDKKMLVKADKKKAN